MPSSTQGRALVGEPVFGVNLIRDRVLSRAARRILAIAGSIWLTANLCVFLWLLIAAGKAATISMSSAPGAAISDVSAMRKQAEEDLALLRARIAAQQATLPLAGKLGVLSTTLPPRTWMTQISGKRDGRQMNVKASYAVDPDHPYDVPATAWVQALRADPVFGGGLSKLDVGATARTMVGDAEMVTFELTAQWGQ